MRNAITAGILVAAVAACGGEQATIPAPTVSDSAGVRFVSNRIPATGIPDYAEVDPTPDLEMRGGPPGPFVDVERAFTLGDGRIVVANRSTFKVRYYQPDGTFIGEVGDYGDAFGQFQDLSRIGRAGGDSVWAYDVEVERLTMLDGEGTPVLEAKAPGREFVVGRFGDGSYLLVPGWRTEAHFRNPVDTVRRDTAEYHRWFPETGQETRVGTFPHNEVLVLEPEEAEGLVVGTPPFGRQTVRAVGPGRFYVGRQNEFEIRGYDADGTLREVISLEGVDLALTPALMDEARRLTAPDPASSEPAWAEDFWAAVPDTRPAYGPLLLDAVGNLWVGEHVVDLSPPRNWMVFSPEGALLGLVEVPFNFRVFEVGQTYILGASPGLPGAEIVKRLPMRRLR